jgi:hypothetical protein
MARISDTVAHQDFMIDKDGEVYRLWAVKQGTTTPIGSAPLFRGDDYLVDLTATNINEDPKHLLAYYAQHPNTYNQFKPYFENLLQNHQLSQVEPTDVGPLGRRAFFGMKGPVV